MKQDCEKYNECRKPVPLCNGKCPEYKKAKFVIITGNKRKK